MFILFTSLLFIPYVLAYQWICLEEGESPPAGDYVCGAPLCIMCIDNNGYPSNPLNCFDQGYDCSDTGGGLPDLTPPELIVIQPFEDGLYDDDRFNINLEVDALSKLEYYDGSWHSLCSNCLDYSGSKTFEEGENDIIFRATKKLNDMTDEVEVPFFIDSEAPEFDDMVPESNDYATGEFQVIITEEAELVNVKLHYGIPGNIRVYDLEDSCGTGKDVLCSVDIDLSDFDKNDNFMYYFEASDRVSTVESDIEDDIKVDLSAPNIVSLDYSMDEDDVYFTIFVDENDVDIDYKDNSGSWKILCSNADVDDPCEKKKSFDDGDHDVIIKLEDDTGQMTEETVSFYIDSSAPDFDELLPKKNKYANGEFSVEYTEEEHLASMSLFYGVFNDMRELVMNNCATGKNKICVADVDLQDFDGKDNLQYYFVAKDDVNTAVSDTIEDVNVDLTQPYIASLELTIDQDDVTFHIEVNEDVDVDYMDLMADNPKWKSLDSNAGVGDPVHKKKSFDNGENEVIIKLEDDAGLISEESVSFVIES